jgi:hypothetical protein
LLCDGEETTPATGAIRLYFIDADGDSSALRDQYIAIMPTIPSNFRTRYREPRTHLSWW